MTKKADDVKTILGSLYNVCIIAGTALGNVINNLIDKAFDDEKD